MKSPDEEVSRGTDRGHGVQLIDGVIEGPGGDENYEHVGWVFDFERGEEGQKFKDDETLGSEAVLLGRVTYDGFSKAWPAMEGDVADKLNAMPKYVISRTLVDPDWNNTTVLRGEGRRASSHGLPAGARQRQEAL